MSSTSFACGPRVPLDGGDGGRRGLRSTPPVCEDVRPADDGVERRAQLVRHRGEELVLHPVGVLCIAPRAISAWRRRRSRESSSVSEARVEQRVLDLVGGRVKGTRSMSCCSRSDARCGSRKWAESTPTTCPERGDQRCASGTRGTRRAGRPRAPMRSDVIRLDVLDRHSLAAPGTRSRRSRARGDPAQLVDEPRVESPLRFELEALPVWRRRRTERPRSVAAAARARHPAPPRTSRRRPADPSVLSTVAWSSPEVCDREQGAAGAVRRRRDLDDSPLAPGAPGIAPVSRPGMPSRRFPSGKDQPSLKFSSRGHRRLAPSTRVGAVA